MENTNDNKAKFFAQYWGQDIFKDSMGFKLEGFDIFRRSWISGVFAELKPLSAITDEDLLFCFGEGFKVKERDEYLIRIIKGDTSLAVWFDGEILLDDGTDQNPLGILCAYQNMQSLGYAIEWMGLSVEKQIEYGWIKLTE